MDISRQVMARTGAASAGGNIKEAKLLKFRGGDHYKVGYYAVRLRSRTGRPPGAEF